MTLIGAQQLNAYSNCLPESSHLRRSYTYVEDWVKLNGTWSETTPLINNPHIFILLFILIIFWGFFIYGTSIPPQLETYPNNKSFPIGQIISTDCHRNRQPYVEGFTFSQVSSFIFHQTIFNEYRTIPTRIPNLRSGIHRSLGIRCLAPSCLPLMIILFLEADLIDYSCLN